jgi:hypothetical protein
MTCTELSTPGQPHRSGDEVAVTASRDQGVADGGGEGRDLDLIAFIVVLATGVTLVALGLSPESLAAVAAALAGLYSAWRADRPTRTDVRRERLGPAEAEAGEKPERPDSAVSGGGGVR